MEGYLCYAFEDICYKLFKKYYPIWPELARQWDSYKILCTMLKQDSCFKETLLGWHVVEVPESVKKELEKKELKKKPNIIVNYMKENISPIISKAIDNRNSYRDCDGNCDRGRNGRLSIKLNR